MMLPRFYIAETFPSEGEYILPGAVAHHAMQVLRLHAGDEIVLFDGAGAEYPARIVDAGRQPRVLIHGMRKVDRESPLAIDVVQALASGDKMDWIVQKAVELGARSFQPIVAQRSVLKLQGERAVKRVAHWRQIAAAASEQCGRNRLMSVAEPIPLAQWLAMPYAGRRYVLDPTQGASLSISPGQGESVAILVGPEGGWSESELQAAQAAKCAPLSLGPRVMRTETAGLAAVAALQAKWGDF